MPTTLEWFGTATFRVRDAGLDLFFDAYLDRLPGLEPVGLSTAGVGKADFVFVSHAHFDHLYGADALALGAGATVVASPESARCLRACGVPENQLLVVTGGETVHCGPTTTVRVLPALHACLFAHSESDTSVPCLGDLDVGAQQRADAVVGLFGAMDAAPEPAGPALVAMNERCSRHDGGQLAYLLTTAGGSMLVSGSAGYWRGIFDGLRPDVACCPSAEGPTSTASRSRARAVRIHARAGAAPSSTPGRVLPPRPAVPRPAGRRHRACRGGPGGPRRARNVLRDGVRRAAPALLGRPGSGKGTLSPICAMSTPAVWRDGGRKCHQTGLERHRGCASRRQCLRDLAGRNPGGLG